MIDPWEIGIIVGGSVWVVGNIGYGWHYLLMGSRRATAYQRAAWLRQIEKGRMRAEKHLAKRRKVLLGDEREPGGLA